MSDSRIRSFEDLDAWKNCRQVKLYVRDLVRSWPEHERFKLIDQIIRSSRAPCAHIAEGFGRFYEKDNVRYCRMAKGELNETRNHIWDALDEGYITSSQQAEANNLIERALMTVNGYISYLNRLAATPSQTSEPEALYGPTAS